MPHGGALRSGESGSRLEDLLRSLNLPVSGSPPELRAMEARPGVTDPGLMTMGARPGVPDPGLMPMGDRPGVTDPGIRTMEGRPGVTDPPPGEEVQGTGLAQENGSGRGWGAFLRSPEFIQLLAMLGGGALGGTHVGAGLGRGFTQFNQQKLQLEREDAAIKRREEEEKKRVAAELARHTKEFELRESQFEETKSQNKAQNKRLDDLQGLRVLDAQREAGFDVSDEEYRRVLGVSPKTWRTKNYIPTPKLLREKFGAPDLIRVNGDKDALETYRLLWTTEVGLMKAGKEAKPLFRAKYDALIKAGVPVTEAMLTAVTGQRTGTGSGRPTAETDSTKLIRRALLELGYSPDMDPSSRGPEVEAKIFRTAATFAPGRKLDTGPTPPSAWRIGNEIGNEIGRLQDRWRGASDEELEAQMKANKLDGGVTYENIEELARINVERRYGVSKAVPAQKGTDESPTDESTTRHDPKRVASAAQVILRKGVGTLAEAIKMVRAEFKDKSLQQAIIEAIKPLLEERLQKTGGHLITAPSDNPSLLRNQLNLGIEEDVGRRIGVGQ